MIINNQMVNDVAEQAAWDPEARSRYHQIADELLGRIGCTDVRHYGEKAPLAMAGYVIGKGKMGVTVEFRRALSDYGVELEINSPLGRKIVPNTKVDDVDFVRSQVESMWCVPAFDSGPIPTAAQISLF